MKKNIEGVIKVFIYATFFVPLVVLPSSYIFPFIVPKILLFRSLMAVVLGGYALLLIINWQEYRPKFTWINAVLALFLLSFAISTFVGSDWYHSFWDNHERMLGLFTIFHYVALYFVSTAVFKNWKDWLLAFRIFLIAGSLVMFIGLLQVGDPQLLLNQGSARVASTLGNSIYVGGYGLFLTFLAYLLVIREKNRGFWFYAEIIMGIMAVLGMFFSGSRGSMLGLLAGIGVAIISYIIVLKSHKNIRLSLLGLLIFIIVIAGLLIGFRKTDFVSNLPAVGRTVNSSLSGLMQSPRWMAWEIAIEAWKEKPVFGWGPNNFFYAFNEHYNPKLLEHGYGETWFDNAHNIIMNTLAVQGAFGILVYLSMFGISIYVLIRSRQKSELNYHVVIVGIAFLVAHLTQNVTVFENPTSYLYFMIWLSFLNSQVVGSIDQIKPNKTIGYGSIFSVGLFVLIIVFIFNIQPSRANSKTLQAIRVISGNPVLAAGEMKNALEFASPHVDDIRSDIARNISQSFNKLYQDLGKEKSEEILDLAYDNLKKNITLHPLDIRNHMTLSQLARLKGLINQDGKYLLETESLLQDALNKSPKRQQVIYSLAATKLELNKFDEAIKLFERAINDNPVIAESYWRMAYAYKMNNNQKKAVEIINQARKEGIIFSVNDESVITSIFSTSTK